MLQKSRLSIIALFAALVLAACGTAQSRGPVTVEITLKEFTVESSLRDFKPGTPYHFKVTNAGKIPHEFMIMPLMMDGMDMSGMQAMTMEERDAAALFMIPEAQLGPGATAEVDYTFEKGFTGEGIEIVCTLPGHLEAGMHTPVRIAN
jgi:uncharacterized cupredoxin-like copper-binding protein